MIVSTLGRKTISYYTDLQIYEKLSIVFSVALLKFCALIGYYGWQEGGGGIGAYEYELLGMRKLSLALSASSKKKENWLATINNGKLPDFISVRTRTLAVT